MEDIFHGPPGKSCLMSFARANIMMSRQNILQAYNTEQVSQRIRGSLVLFFDFF